VLPVPAVMPGLVPGIHVFLLQPLLGSKSWMAGTSPAMTSCGSVPSSI